MDRFEQEVQKHKRRRLWRNLLLAFLLFLVPPSVVAYFFGQGKQVKEIVGAVAEVWASPDLVFEGRDQISVVFIGIDVNRDRRGMPYTKHSRSDTILVVSFDRLGKMINAISIPRDTLARIPDHYTTKINAAHAIGGPELLLETLRESLGIQADFFVKVRFAGLEKAVDAVGGVDLDVEKDMDYDDSWGQLHIHLKKGLQHLDGPRAHQYARFRHDAMGDIGRVARQQKLMKTLAKKMLSPSMVVHIPKLIEVFQQFVETNLSTAQLMSLGAFVRSVNPDAIATETLPGSPRGGYWVADRDKAAEVLARILGNTFDQGSWETRYSNSISGMRSTRSKAGGRASEPPLETTATIPEAAPEEPRSSTHNPSPEEPVVISPIEPEGEHRDTTTPSKSSGAGSTIPAPASEGGTGNPAETGAGSKAGKSGSNEGGRGSNPKPDPPSATPDRPNPPAPAAGNNP